MRCFNSVVCSAFVVCLFWLQTSFCHQTINNEQTLPAKLKEQIALVGKEDMNADCCSVTPTDIQLTRSTIKKGFHRDVQTSLRVLLDPRHRCTTCRVLMIESLPKGLYVDLYQAEASALFGGPQILAFEDIDLEKPAYLSRAHTILVYPPKVSYITPSSPSHLHNDNDMVNFTSEMTVHLRYHRPSDHPEIQSAIVILQAPYLLMRCREVSSGRSSTATDKTGGKTTVQLYKAPCDGTNKTLCNWQLLPLNNRESKELYFDVAVGQTSHTFVVVTVTILATAVSTVSLLFVMSRSTEKSKPD
ncbi:phosphatidylinositol-glycan biosynthesis class X protein-like [Asterias rubens]|uniref:phosphatidylinositol-glycan biosynthesis class X protein-like n=1 Tax=Asterias rubens TaxID=7604 RepID=UPI001455C710|nr:phosphatidylinositol-glycan biosynthesis class X protein-like [Asterias rubens]